MTWKAEVSDSAVQSTTVLREPSRQQKNEGEINFSALRAETVATPLYTAFGSGRTTPKYLAPALTHTHTHTHTPPSSASTGSVLCSVESPVRVATRVEARIIVFNIEIPITVGFPVSAAWECHQKARYTDIQKKWKARIHWL